MKIERILANNPGPFTGPGTNTWILDDASGNVAVIDPGPIDELHRQSITSAVGDRTPVAVLVTHTHPDHAPLANPLAREWSVPALGFRPGPSFDPDGLLVDGGQVAVGDLSVEVVHTPGHADDHVCFRVANVLFSGDHIMGGSSVMVEAMGPYLESLRKVRGTGLQRIHPGHGEEIDHPDQVIDWYVAHRLQRHEEVYRAVLEGANSVPDIVEKVYAEVDRALHVLAARSVEAHVLLLSQEGRLAFDGEVIVSKPSQNQC